MDGVLVVDKPEGWSSHDAVNKLRRLTGIRRIGHLGTLDPMATGVLPLVIGRATRLAQFFVRAEKVYDAVIRFGCATDTYDRDGTPASQESEPQFNRAALESALESFKGLLMQTPPPVSAKKIRGAPAYKLARRNVPVELKPVEVTVYSLDLIEWVPPEARVVVHCSAGTYLRSIAHDLGRALGGGAFLKSLCRKVSGDFKLEQARPIPELERMAEDNRIGEAIIPASELLPQFPSEIVDLVTASQIRQGRDFRVSPFRARPATRYVKAVTGQGELLAIGELKLPNVYHPFLVL
ncbi:MAG TPA: tRNA pseudouridine(55) synthase TruB [Bryobacteraceae bacterium]|nr:tRNA pseudouridine(55) synthase TruB [Bryobacteraceae bacterium]